MAINSLSSPPQPGIEHGMGTDTITFAALNDPALKPDVGEIENLQNNSALYSSLGYKLEELDDGGMRLTAPNADGWNSILESAGIADRHFVNVDEFIENDEFGEMVGRGEIPYGRGRSERGHDSLAHALGFAAAPSRTFELMQTGKLDSDIVSTALSNPSEVSEETFRRLYKSFGVKQRLFIPALAKREYRRYKENLEKLSNTPEQLPIT